MKKRIKKWLLRQLFTEEEIRIEQLSRHVIMYEAHQMISGPSMSYASPSIQRDIIESAYSNMRSQILKDLVLSGDMVMEARNDSRSMGTHLAVYLKVWRTKL